MKYMLIWILFFADLLTGQIGSFKAKRFHSSTASPDAALCASDPLCDFVEDRCIIRERETGKQDFLGPRAGLC